MKKKSIFYGAISLSASIVLIFLWITQKPDSLDTALKLAGSNRVELEKVLEYYSKNKADSLKQKAAKFLIENMPGHYAFDTSSLALYRPVLRTYDSLFQLKKINPKFEYSDQLNEKWNELKSKYSLYENIYNKPLQPDIENVSSGFLIGQIDQAFSAWDSSKRIIDIDFKTFCEYVLPYRRQKGVCIEDWRTHFKNDEIRIYNPFDIPIEAIVDSILYQYSEFVPKGLKHTGKDVADYPYLKLYDICISKRVFCETRCWFNSMLLASLGLPVAIDYVPAWGNRDNSHAWNVIVTKDGPLAFESFWDRDRWKYNRIYNNKDSDKWWGKFRLAKVFRYSYISIADGPIMDKNEKPENVPPFFHNMKQKDVSEEYFATSDVKIELPLISRGPRYAWLCVNNMGKWVPVQWGKIENKQAVFKKMGRDIVYLPVVYNNGIITPAASPFILTSEGKIKTLKPGTERKEIQLIRKYPLNVLNQIRANALIGSKIQVSDDSNFYNSTTIFQLKQAPELFMDTIKLNLNKKYRYVRLLFPEPNLSGLPAKEDGFQQEEPRRIAELAFFDNFNKKDPPLSGKIIYSDGIDSVNAIKCFDHDVLTMTVPYFKSYERPNECSCWIGLDFQKKQTISSVAFCPQNDKNNIYPGLNYELFYWDNEWVSLGVQKANNPVLNYNNVPENALFLLHCLDEGKEERIFTYENGNQVWW